MIELKIENKVYEMPNSWEEVSIKKYIEIQNLEGEEGTRKLIKVISILSDIDLKTLYQVQLEDLNQFDMGWLGKEIENGIEKTIDIDGIKYGIVKDMKKLSLGEYVDLDFFVKDMDNNFHNIVAVLMRPVIQEEDGIYMIEKYDPETASIRADIFFEKMNVKQLLNSSSFFLNSANGFLENMKTFSV